VAGVQGACTLAKHQVGLHRPVVAAAAAVAAAVAAAATVATAAAALLSEQL
jgi:hypothetical protein